MSFIIVLGAVIFILCAVGVCLLIRQPKQSKQHQNKFKPMLKSKPKKIKRSKLKNKINRYQKSSAPKVEPRLGSSPFEMQSNDETDVVLGLRDNDNDVDIEAPEDALKAKRFRIDSVIGERKLIVFYLRAEGSKPFAGYELLQSLLSTNLRFGDMDIFHHQLGFSLASITPPGTFDMDKMGGFSCAGLSLFLSLETCADPLVAFQVMLDTADQLVQDLGGSVLDEGQALLTKEKVLELYQELQNAYV